MTKFLDWSKFNAFADDKTDVTENLKFVLGTVENIAGKGAFSPVPTIFSKGLFCRVDRNCDCVGKGSEKTQASENSVG